jgi:hypothetical protein
LESNNPSLHQTQGESGFDPNDPSYQQLEATGGPSAGPVASGQVCDDGWALASISRPDVGTTDGETLFQAQDGQWVEADQVNGAAPACALEMDGVPSDIAIVLSRGVQDSPISGC